MAVLELVNAERVNLLLAGSGLVALWVGWLWKIRPAVRRLSGRVGGALDNLGGRREGYDYATGQRIPAIPALGERLGGIELKQAEMSETLDKLADVHTQLQDHGRRLEALEIAAAERISIRLENASLLHAAGELRDEPANPHSRAEQTEQELDALPERNDRS